MSPTTEKHHGVTRRRDRRTQLHLFGLAARSTRRDTTETSVVARITVRALRAGLGPSWNDTAVVDQLVKLAGGDVRLLTHALHRMSREDGLDPVSEAGARSVELLRRAVAVSSAHADVEP